MSAATQDETIDRAEFRRAVEGLTGQPIDETPYAPIIGTAMGMIDLDDGSQRASALNNLRFLANELLMLADSLDLAKGGSRA